MRAVQPPSCQHIILVEHDGWSELRIVPNQFALLRSRPDRSRQSVTAPDLVTQHPHARREVSDGYGLRKDRERSAGFPGVACFASDSNAVLGARSNRHTVTKPWAQSAGRASSKIICVSNGNPSISFGAGEISDLLDCGEVGTLTSFFNRRGTGGAAGKEDIVSEMKQRLLCPERAIVGSARG